MKKLIFLPILAFLWLAVPAPVQLQEKPQITYVASKNSNKFHRPSCRWAKKIAAKNLCGFQSREEALKKGYIPCKVCRP